MTANTTNIRVEPGKQEMVITREFDAPREKTGRQQWISLDSSGHWIGF